MEYSPYTSKSEVHRDITADDRPVNLAAVWGDDHFKVRNFNRWLETHTAPDVTPTMGLL